MADYYNRQKGTIEKEKEVGGKAIEWLYQTSFGRLLLKLLVGPSFSNWKAKQNSKPSSAKKIADFVENYDIDLSEAEKDSFHSFNDFFTRKLKPTARPIDSNPQSVVAVCDGKLQVFPLNHQTQFTIKNSQYSLLDIIQDEMLAETFKGGYCFVYRLSMDDYHRYIYPDGGRCLTEGRIKGKLHTVRPIAHEFVSVFSENTRHWQLLATQHFGQLLYMEVGAMLVGKIQNHGHSRFERGQEKGYFEYGASTIIVCYQKDKLKVAGDILRQSRAGVEVKVKLGEKVGEAYV